MTVPEDISIVMAVYNHENTLKDAIESALMQKMPYTSRIYCIDDASTDRSQNILSDYAKKYPDRINIYTSKINQGSGRMAFYHNRPPVKGRYWCLLAGDDYWTDKKKLGKQISFLDKNPEFVGCSCNTLAKNEINGKNSIIQPDQSTWNLLDLLLMNRKYSFYVHTTGIIWRNIYLTKGFFLPPAFKRKYASGDVILMHMMLSEGGKIYNIPEEMSCYRITGNGVWTKKTTSEQQELNEKLKSNIWRSIPLKYKLIIRLQKLRRASESMKRIIPGPVNE